MSKEKNKKEDPVVRHRYESDMTRQERRQVEKEKLSSMNWKGKVGYLWTYYKYVLVIAIGVIIAITIIAQTVENAKYKDILSVAVNQPGVTFDNDVFTETVNQAIGTGEKYDRVSVDSSYSMADAESADYNMVMKFTTVVAAQSIDVFFTNEDIYSHYNDQGMFKDLSEILTPEECAQYGISKGDTYLDVSDSEWMKSMGIADYKPVYLTVIANSEHTDKIKEFIKLVEEGK
ncbi:MAG: hypothetical protein PHG16_11195 [Lachnospiraceae bacterium]|nr:hypothetical protein [Lachnospiraceae bacterium]